MADLQDFVVSRSDLRRTAFVPAAQTPDTALDTGEILVRITRFALTANNITYGAVGEMIGYWTFFPAPEGWGRIPVWGFADVVRSQHPMPQSVPFALSTSVQIASIDSGNATSSQLTEMPV